MTRKQSYNSDEVNHLADQIIHHKSLYYRGKPAISDEEFDALEDRLKQIHPDHPVLHMVGGEFESTNRKVEHTTPMLSLQKTYVFDDLVSWQGSHKIVGMMKIDGNSLSLIYQEGKIQLAKTRGNGRIGEDVTDKARWVGDVIPSLSDPRSIEIRGELYCTESNFAHLAKKMVESGLERPTNPRNIVAGMLGRKTNFDLSRYFNFFAFDVIDLENPDNDIFPTEMQKFSWLEKQGFSIPEPQLLTETKDLQTYLDMVKSKMEEGEIGLDGAVFSYDEITLHRELGNTSHHPRFKMSFKWQGETAISEIQSFTWATSRRGVVTPVAVIEPVYLSGASITNITLHNASHVTTHNLKVGDTIEIVRSGEVIPKFLRVVESKKGSYSLPEVCPSCNESLEMDDIRLMCRNSKCPAQKLLSILNWIKSVEIEDLSEKRLLPLVDLELVQDIPDLYRLKKPDFYKIPNTKDKMAEKLYQNIQKSKSVSLARFLLGLGIEGTGLTSWEKLLENFPGLDHIQAVSAEDVAAVEGFAEKSADLIVRGLAENKTLIGDLLALGVTPEWNEPQATEGQQPLAGLSFVITGTLSRPRSEIEQSIKQAGGKTASAVSKNTHAVITGDPDSNSSKMKKARSLDIAIWSEEKLLDQIR